MSAEIHLEVYRPFQGKLRDDGARFWPLATTGLRTALKQRRALFILYLPALIVTIMMCFGVYAKFFLEGVAEQIPREEMDIQTQLLETVARAQAEQLIGVVSLILWFSKVMAAFALLAVSWFGSGLFCEDKKAGAHQLYFARPLTRFDYFLGKFLVASFFAALATLVPLLAVCIAASLFSPEWSFLKQEWDVFLRVISFSLVWTIVVCSLVLLFSSVASRRSFAMLGILGFVMLTVPIGGILGKFADPDLYALTLLFDMHTVSQHLFGRLEAEAELSAGPAWAALTALVLFCWTVIAWRLRRLEVVA